MDYSVIIRRFIRDDLNVLLGMTKEEGWGFSHVDCRASLEVDSNGLLVAEDNLGAPVGFIGLFTQLPGMTYLAAFVVRKDLRGKRIGKKLWSAMLNATKGNILVIDGVSEMKQWYTTQGFNYEAYWIKCYKGTITSKEHVTNHSTYDFIPISDNVWPALLAYDGQIFPYKRENALRSWFRNSDTYSIVAMHNKSVVGYANFHWKSENECNIRALYGDDKAVADALLENLLQKIPVGSVVVFDLLGDKPIPQCFETFKCLFISHKLYTSEIHGIQTDKIFFSTTYMV